MDYIVELVMNGHDKARRTFFSFVPQRLARTYKSKRSAEDYFAQMVADYGRRFKPSEVYGVFVRMRSGGRAFRIVQVN